MKVYLLLYIILIFSTFSVSQDLDILEETTAGNYSGFGARQMSMGGAGIANTIDGAAIFYNPAALARIPRIEFQIGLTHQYMSNETNMPPVRYDPSAFASTVNSAADNTKKTRFGSVNLSIPVPTYRGSLVISGGIDRVMNFDRVGLFHVTDRRISDTALVDDYAQETESGSIYLYAVGAGIDITPHISLGGAINIYSGTDFFVYQYRWLDETLTPSSGGFTNRFEDDYFGIGFKGGLLFRPNSKLTIGVTMESPLFWDINQHYTNTDESIDEIVNYNLTRPFTLGAGIAMRFSQLTLTGEGEYIDWSRMKYGDNPDMEIYNDSLPSLYRQVINLRIGGEYLFPQIGFSLRAGLFSQPLPYDKKFIIDDRMGYSVGFGWLLGKDLLIETAYVKTKLTRTYTAVNAEYTVADNKMAIAEDSFRRLYVTLSYRY